jgi:hypothetical protein
MSPFLIYIGAEGYSEALAKKTVEESKAKVEITEKVMQEIINNQNNKDEN